ncbi:MAG: aspartate-semialdehyde dehydrogenase [Candidatus Methanoliparum thermophilum]|uniref:aspartate-semialdehyde dehydrogenase n=1 Tax=Methanoliparum thermophilum TaxID=2491083 RepID=A0A520KS81_METT2|nr:aspartate-semialdehyde dehydrogenase [Candidatus Methanoliparum sp. LAM-1]RZN64640.1 MAG: aspartate-semialdehyde dehydrogenase [Candidatus Methanoliparum thermophilum]BDC35734.1 aspartate-semialdehyde dehydrogenase [Candidatus Methanoliparum sp. LAM-1]
MDKKKVAILGATGAVGQRFIQLLDKHPWFEITGLAASERNVGKKYKDTKKWRLDTQLPEEIGEYEILPMDPKKIDADLVFSALPADVAGEIETNFAKEGIAVSSNASANRMEKDIPLIIPEVNKEHLYLIDLQKEKRGWEGFIITNPNCSVIGLVVTLKPLMKFCMKEVRVATMQAVSGAGFDGVSSMDILDNVIPYIKNEEEKMETETLKLLGTIDNDGIKPATIKVSASCHRVCVIDGHTESIWVKTDQKIDAEDVKKAFLTFDPQLKDLPSEPKKVIFLHDREDRPQARLDRNIGRGMTVSVGRVRNDFDGIKYIALSHNTIRGAAGASILNGELLVREGYV